MFDVMIVADDRALRQELIKSIPWESCGVRLLCEAEDCDTAMELYLLYRPKIIVADLGLPQMQSLQLVQQLQEEDAQLQFVLLTREDFSATRNKLDLRTVSLLSMPLRMQELEYCLCKAARQLQTDKERMTSAAGLSQIFHQNRSHMQETFLAELVGTEPEEPELIDQKAAQLHLPLTGPRFVVADIDVIPVTMKRSLWGAIRYILRDCLYESVEGTGCSVYAFPDMERRMHAIFSTALENPDDVIEELLTRLRQTASQNYGVELKAGIGPAVSDLASLYISGTGARLAISYQSLLEETPVVHYKNLEKLGTLSNYPVFDHIRKLFRQRKLEELKQFLWGKVQAVPVGSNPTTGILFEYITIVTGEALNAGLEESHLEDCSKLLAKIFQARSPEASLKAVVRLTESLLDQISARRSTNTSQLITMAKEYIQENISNDQLNLEQVSNFVGLSRIYFCKRFHQAEGVSFSNYLKAARIEKAKQLLTTTGMKIFEVGSAVGFSNPKYFSYVFKQETGQTPLEFQKELKKG